MSQKRSNNKPLTKTKKMDSKIVTEKLEQIKTLVGEIEEEVKKEEEGTGSSEGGE